MPKHEFEDRPISPQAPPSHETPTPPSFLLDQYWHPEVRHDESPSYIPTALELNSLTDAETLTLAHPGTLIATFTVKLDTARIRGISGFWKSLKVPRGWPNPAFEDRFPGFTLYYTTDRDELCVLTPYSTDSTYSCEFGFKMNVIGLQEPVVIKVSNVFKSSARAVATFTLPFTGGVYEWRGEKDAFEMAQDEEVILTLFLKGESKKSALVPRASVFDLLKSRASKTTPDLIPMGTVLLSNLSRNSYSMNGVLTSMEGHGDGVLWRSKAEAAVFACSAVAAAFMIKYMKIMRIHKTFPSTSVQVTRY